MADHFSGGGIAVGQFYRVLEYMQDHTVENFLGAGFYFCEVFKDFHILPSFFYILPRGRENATESGLTKIVCFEKE